MIATLGAARCRGKFLSSAEVRAAADGSAEDEEAPDDIPPLPRFRYF